MSEWEKAMEGLATFILDHAPDNTGACGEPGCNSCQETKPHPARMHLQIVRDEIMRLRARLETLRSGIKNDWNLATSENLLGHDPKPKAPCKTCGDGASWMSSGSS